MKLREPNLTICTPKVKFLKIHCGAPSFLKNRAKKIVFSLFDNLNTEIQRDLYKFMILKLKMKLFSTKTFYIKLTLS